MATPPDLNVHVGVPMASDGVIVRVMESPLLPLPVPATARTAAEAVGWVLSIVMAEPEVRDVTADATALPAESVNVHENAIAPSWSALSTVTAAVWLSDPVVP